MLSSMNRRLRRWASWAHSSSECVSMSVGIPKDNMENLLPVWDDIAIIYKKIAQMDGAD